MNTSSRQAVAAIVRRKDKILLVRQQNPDDPDPAWALPGGVLEPDELMDAALRREVLEETGLTIDGAQRLLYVCQHNFPGLGVFTVHVFELGAGDSDSGDSDAGDSGAGDSGAEIAGADPDGDIIEARWFGQAEAIDVLDEQPFRPMRDPVVAYLRNESAVPSVWIWADVAADPTVIPPLPST